MKISDLVTNLSENEGFSEKPVPQLAHRPVKYPPRSLRFSKMRRDQLHFTCKYPGKKFRHEKPDLKVLLEKRQEDYIDLSQAPWLMSSMVHG